MEHYHEIPSELNYVSFLTSCASGTWSHHSGNNNSYSRDAGYCKALARSQYPGYICRNPLMCAPDETNKVLDQIIQSKQLLINACIKKVMTISKNLYLKKNVKMIKSNVWKLQKFGISTGKKVSKRFV